MLARAIPFLALLLLSSHAPGSPKIGEPVGPIDVAHWINVPEISAQGEYTPVTELGGGRIYVFEFWATWCAPCIAKFDEIADLQREHADDGVTVIGLTEEPLPLVVRFLRRTHAGTGMTHFERTDYMMGVDPDGSVLAQVIPSDLRNVRPMAGIVDREGMLAYVGIPGEEMEDALKQIIAGTWDARAFAEESARRGAVQKQQERILEEEDWAAVRASFWDSEEFLARVAFAIAFNYGGQIENADQVFAEQAANRAIELTDGRSIFAHHALAKVYWNAGEKALALATQQRAVELIEALDEPYPNEGYIRGQLKQYESGQ